MVIPVQSIQMPISVAWAWVVRSNLAVAQLAVLAVGCPAVMIPVQSIQMPISVAWAWVVRSNLAVAQLALPVVGCPV